MENKTGVWAMVLFPGSHNIDQLVKGFEASDFNTSSTPRRSLINFSANRCRAFHCHICEWCPKFARDPANDLLLQADPSTISALDDRRGNDETRITHQFIELFARRRTEHVLGCLHGMQDHAAFTVVSTVQFEQKR
jgi:hypothetical protein